jgi:hypothetical protein
MISSTYHWLDAGVQARFATTLCVWFRDYSGAAFEPVA